MPASAMFRPRDTRPPLPVTPQPTIRERHAAEHDLLDRRKGLLGRSRVAALAATFTLVAIAALLAALLFAAVANIGSRQPTGAPRVSAVPQGQDALQVVHADPLDRSQVMAYLSVPGRVAVNGPAGLGVPVVGGGVPLAADGQVTAGDTLRVCVYAPAVPAVELTLVDTASGAVVGGHVFLNPPTCTQ